MLLEGMICSCAVKWKKVLLEGIICRCAVKCEGILLEGMMCSCMDAGWGMLLIVLACLAGLALVGTLSMLLVRRLRSSRGNTFTRSDSFTKY